MHSLTRSSFLCVSFGILVEGSSTENRSIAFLSRYFPLLRDPSGLPYLTLEDNVYLTLGTSTYSSTDAQNNLSNPQYSLGIHSIRATQSANIPSIGIGSGSPLLEQVGSVGVFRNPNQIVLGISSEDFESQCEPRTRINIPSNALLSARISTSNYMYSGEQSAGPIHFSDRLHMFPANIARAIRLHFVNGGATIEHIPPSIAGSAMVEFESWDFRAPAQPFTLIPEDPETVMIGNCDAVLVSGAPTLIIEIEQGIGRLVLYPTDYIHHDPARNVCIFLFNAATERSNMFSIAPLTIPGTNVFVTDAQISICESVQSD